MFNLVRKRKTRLVDFDAEKITVPGNIQRLLKQLTKHYSPLNIRIKNHKVPYASCIVGVEQPYLLLDELLPTSGHQRLLDDRTIYVSGKLNGVDIRFTTTLVRADQQKGVLTYYMKMPTELTYQQRRMAYRVRIPMSIQLRVLIDNGTNTLIGGVLHDLSHGGAGKIIPVGDAHIETGQHYECIIELPNRQWLICTVEMRYKKTLNVPDKQLLGAKFIGLTPIQSRLISRCISELELEEIRKRAF